MREDKELLSERDRDAEGFLGEELFDDGTCLAKFTACDRLDGAHQALDELRLRLKIDPARLDEYADEILRREGADRARDEERERLREENPLLFFDRLAAKAEKNMGSRIARSPIARQASLACALHQMRELKGALVDIAERGHLIGANSGRARRRLIIAEHLAEGEAISGERMQ